MLHSPVRAVGATPPATNSVTLAWDASGGPSVTGYRVYYGQTSGSYSTSVVGGNVPTIRVDGLAEGVTYYFAVTAFTATGLESDFSNELSVTVPETVPGGLVTIQIRAAANRVVTLTVAGEVGRTYDLQATPDFAAWTVIGTVTIGANGSVNFVDTNAGSSPKRFYRTRDAQP